MANTYAMKSLDEQITKTISTMRKCKKGPDETPIYDSSKIFPENCHIDDTLFWDRMKYIDENKVIYNKAAKNGNLFHILKRDWETVPFPIDQTTSNTISF